MFVMFVTGLVFLLAQSVGLTTDISQPLWSPDGHSDCLSVSVSHSHLTNWNNEQLQTELLLPEDRSLPDGLRDVLVWNHRKLLQGNLLQLLCVWLG